MCPHACGSRRCSGPPAGLSRLGAARRRSAAPTPSTLRTRLVALARRRGDLVAHIERAGHAPDRGRAIVPWGGGGGGWRLGDAGFGEREQASPLTLASGARRRGCLVSRRAPKTEQGVAGAACGGASRQRAHCSGRQQSARPARGPGRRQAVLGGVDLVMRGIDDRQTDRATRRRARLATRAGCRSASRLGRAGASPAPPSRAVRARFFLGGMAPRAAAEGRSRRCRAAPSCRFSIRSSAPARAAAAALRSRRLAQPAARPPSERAIVLVRWPCEG